MTDKGRKKNDVIIIVLLIVISLSFLLVNNIIKQQQVGEIVHIESNNKLYGIYQLNENQEIIIKTDEAINVIVIEEGQVYMKESNCHNQDCVNHKSISKQGEQIVCLPNKVVVEIINSGDSDIDALSE